MQNGQNKNHFTEHRREYLSNEEGAVRMKDVEHMGENDRLPLKDAIPIWGVFAISCWGSVFALIMAFTVPRVLLCGFIGAILAFIVKAVSKKLKRSFIATFLHYAIGLIACFSLMAVAFAPDAGVWAKLGASIVVYLGIGVPRIVEVIKELGKN